MEDRISIRLIGPAKIDGNWRKPDDMVDVTTDQLRDLVSAGVVANSEDRHVADLAPGIPSFDEAVGAMAKVLADAAVAAAVDAAHAEIVADRDAARIRATDAEAEVSRQHARIMALEAELHDAQGEIATLKAAPVEASAAPVTPKPAPKKGGGAKQG
ncbi:hypothetical protein [Paracoccus lutimaris]|uniref:Uncharacterized protein n=1 Tax=Paracoccus lutimaris TaxID=1490030 RepID=A0A368YC29_9RHOB|nr:hypothetical protein [Paracoccus lutimaris]RCW77810.1 hypothetical protein DFP89_1564 [Paracoccus lutimaris]